MICRMHLPPITPLRFYCFVSCLRNEKYIWFSLCRSTVLKPSRILPGCEWVCPSLPLAHICDSRPPLNWCVSLTCGCVVIADHRSDFSCLMKIVLSQHPEYFGIWAQGFSSLVRCREDPPVSRFCGGDSRNSSPVASFSFGVATCPLFLSEAWRHEAAINSKRCDLADH